LRNLGSNHIYAANTDDNLEEKFSAEVKKGEKLCASLIDDYLNLGAGAGLHGRPSCKHGRELTAYRHVLFLRGEGVVVGVGVPGQDVEPA